MLLSEEKMRYLQYIQILKIRILPSFNVFLLSSWVKRNYRIIFSISSNIKSNWPTVYRTRIDKCKISIIRYREWFPTRWKSKRDEKRMERADASFQDQNLVRRDELLQFLYICRVNKNVLRCIYSWTLNSGYKYVYLSSIPTDIESIAAHMHTRYSSECVWLPSVPKLNSIVPTTAYQLMCRSGVETRAEHSRFMTVHGFQWLARMR